MPEPTSPIPEDNNNDDQPTGDITESPYTRDRSARDEEVGRTPTPQELEEIRRHSTAPAPSSSAPFSNPGHEPHIPQSPAVTSEQGKERAAIAREILRISRKPEGERTEQELDFLRIHVHDQEEEQQ